MSFDSLLIHEAVVSRLSDSGERDSVQRPINPDEEIRTFRCRVEQRSSTEEFNQRDAVTTNYLVFFEAGALDHLKSTGRFVVDGLTYEIVGRPNPVNDSIGVHHVEVSARVVEG